MLSRTTRKFKARKEKLRDADHISIYHKYIETELDLTKNTLGYAIKNKSHVDNECWINAITDNYKDTLLAKKRNPITRQTILDIIGKTEENVKEGISIDEILPFFKKFGIQLRVYDYIGNLIAQHEPETRSHHYKAMYCFIKGNHIYNMNLDLKSLQQKQDKNVDLALKVSSNYNVSDKTEAHEYKMIDNINDIMKILKETKENNIGGWTELYTYTAGTFDYDKLYDVAYTATLNLNKVIDINFYPISETKLSNMKHRPIGLGIQGLADMLAMMRIPFDSEEAVELNAKIMENADSL